jgi:hypothetical protein
MRLLLDDLAIQQFVRPALVQAGFQVDIVTDGKRAEVRALEGIHDAPARLDRAAGSSRLVVNVDSARHEAAGSAVPSAAISEAINSGLNRRQVRLQEAPDSDRGAGPVDPPITRFREMVRSLLTPESPKESDKASAADFPRMSGCISTVVRRGLK